MIHMILSSRYHPDIIPSQKNSAADFMYSVKGWARFQHFKDRRPPWIKLYRDILDDVEWHELDPASAKALVMLWLIASENEGNLPSIKVLAFRSRLRSRLRSRSRSRIGSRSRSRIGSRIG